MKFGVIARCEDRGLGTQSLEVCRHLDPDRVLVPYIPNDKRFVSHFDWYDEWDATRIPWPGGRLDPDVVRSWLDGLDVVYTAESVYDLRLPGWAAEVGCGVVVHANPEMLCAVEAALPVTWWAPTPWRLEHLPARTRVVPMPVPEAPHAELNGPLRFLHVAGWPAVGDRNGTGIVAEAAAHMSSGAEVVIRGQHKDVARYRRPDLRVEAGNVPDMWDLYRQADVLVSPRRFGGLHLPALEALAAGLIVVMSDCSPNDVWPGPRILTTSTQTVATRAGLIPLHDTDPHALAACLDELATNPELVDKYRQEAADWVHANTWDALRPLWEDELARACW